MRFFTLRCLTITPTRALVGSLARELVPTSVSPSRAHGALENMAPQTRLTTRFCQRLGVLAPVVLAPMGGCAGGRLAAAVAGAGAAATAARASSALSTSTLVPTARSASAIATATLTTTSVAVTAAGGVGLVGSGGESLAYLRTEWAVAVAQPGVLRLGLTLP